MYSACKLNKQGDCILTLNLYIQSLKSGFNVHTLYEIIFKLSFSFKNYQPPLSFCILAIAFLIAVCQQNSIAISLSQGMEVNTIKDHILIRGTFPLNLGFSLLLFKMVGNGNLLQYSCLENPTEEPGGLQSVGSDMMEHTHTHTHISNGSAMCILHQKP